MAISYQSNCQFKVNKYNINEIVFVSSKSDTFFLKNIQFESREGESINYQPKTNDTIIPKKPLSINIESNHLQKVLKSATITYMSSKDNTEKTMKLKLKINNKLYNPYGESIQCQGITKRGSQCSRTTKDVTGYCWQHKP